ncbi:MAG: S8 family serine peptidase [Cyanobacteriota bacterium]|nr:S8 family serine peptidase [Cyanobacteriota bacterium]
MTIDLSSLTASMPEGEFPISSSVDDLLLAALDRGGESLETGRYLLTFNEGQEEQGLSELRSFGISGADTRDFNQQTVELNGLGDTGFLYLSEVNVAIVSGTAFRDLGTSGLLSAQTERGAIASVEPEYFVFASSSDYLRGFARAAQVLADDLAAPERGVEEQPEAEVLGTTWGVAATRANLSAASGRGIKVAVLDTGFDLGHPDFVGRPVVSSSFVGQPVQDLNGHGTHCTGTACGPKAPAGSTPRYGIAHESLIHIGKVLSNSGSGTTATVLAGMNWAISQGCEVISMSLGAQIPVQSAYTNAGQAALDRGLLIVAAAGNAGAATFTGAPANSPTIMAVASLDQNLAPSAYSCSGKIEIAGPGRDVFSSWPRPRMYNTISGTSMATPHVAACAALWAQTSSSLRGIALWRKLQATARPLPYPASRVGAGLVQAP